METAQTVLMPGIIPLTCTSILQWCIVVQCNHRSRELISLFYKILFIFLYYSRVTFPVCSVGIGRNQVNLTSL